MHHFSTFWHVHKLRNALGGGGVKQFVTNHCKDIGICTFFLYKGGWGSKKLKICVTYYVDVPFSEHQIDERKTEQNISIQATDKFFSKFSISFKRNLKNSSDLSANRKKVKSVKLPSNFWIVFRSLILLCADDRGIELHDFNLVQF